MDCKLAKGKAESEIEARRSQSSRYLRDMALPVITERISGIKLQLNEIKNAMEKQMSDLFWRCCMDLNEGVHR